MPPESIHTPKRLLVTGGAGFIGTNFVRQTLAEQPDTAILNLDALTYAGGAENLEGLERDYRDRHFLVRADIRDAEAVAKAFKDFEPDTVVNFAAESHVDRSIDNPLEFIDTNVVGVGVLLEAARAAWKDRTDVRFHQVSTDEVFGSLGLEGVFHEDTPYDPSSPYSASKAAADHLVRAWHRTYGLPATLSNSSNNYGPWQFPEKLIPLVIAKALDGEALPIYGLGANVRDWLHVADHGRALWAILTGGKPGRAYLVGGDNEWSNLELVRLLCGILDDIRPRASGSHRDLITFVPDRPGHDARYAVDSSRLRNELDWSPAYSFEQGLTETVHWYLEHQDWVEAIKRARYDGARLGLAAKS